MEHLVANRDPEMLNGYMKQEAEGDLVIVQY